VHTKREYLDQLAGLIRQRYNCEAVHRRTAVVEEKFEDGTSWKGEVEVFFLAEHPARRCYVWESKREGEREVFMKLEALPNIIGPATAVRAVLEKKAKVRG